MLPPPSSSSSSSTSSMYCSMYLFRSRFSRHASASALRFIRATSCRNFTEFFPRPVDRAALSPCNFNSPPRAVSRMAAIRDVGNCKINFSYKVKRTGRLEQVPAAWRLVSSRRAPFPSGHPPFQRRYIFLPVPPS